jgi:hypothetical protein
MDHTPPTRYRLKIAGVAIALLAFGLTRFIVAEAMAPTTTPTGFLLGQGPFLLAGLAVSVVGVGLAVSTVDAPYANTIAVWATVGAGVMGLVLGSSILEASVLEGGMATVDVRLGSKVLIGGLVGGTLTGFAIARNRRHQAAVDHQNDRLVVLNRLLRHHVLNKANIISGYSDREEEIPAAEVDVLHRSARHITDTIEGVSGLTESYSRGDPNVVATDLTTVLQSVIERIGEESAGAPITADLPSKALPVAASRELDTALSHLLTHLRQSVNESGDALSVSTSQRKGAVALRIESSASLLTERERALLVTGGLPNHDDPAVGFELPMARLLFEQMKATVTVDAANGTDRGERITIWFPRSDRREAGTLAGWAVSPRNVATAGAAGVVAGVAMGIVVQIALGQIAVIGALYGTASPIVGWITHLFHSAVFGIVFAAACSVATLEQWLHSWRRYVLAGAVYGLVLWTVAASVVMPLWLSLVGLPTPVPTFSPGSFLAHLLWGVLVGVGYVRLHSTPTDEDFRERLLAVQSTGVDSVE